MSATTSTARAPFRAASVALAGLLLLGACGSDADDTDAATAAGSDSTTTSTTAAPAPPTSGTIEVTAADYSFKGLPATLAAGSRLTLTNASTKEVHELVGFKLPDTETRSASALVALPMAQLQAVTAGPPAVVLVAPPAKPGFPAVGDGTLTGPGRYLLICTIPTGADPGAYLAAAQASKGGPVQVPGGPPHIANGMYAEVTVK